MRHFPTKANSTFTLPRVHPTYADILSGLAQEPVVGRLLLEPPAACPWHDRNGAEAASVRMTAWLERHDPLFAATVNMLFDVTESWPERMEREFWKRVAGNPLRFLEMYSEVRELAEDRVCSCGGRSGHEYQEKGGVCRA